MDALLEHRRLREVDLEILNTKNDLDLIVPIYEAICRRKAKLEKALKVLEDEKLSLIQGQLAMPF